MRQRAAGLDRRGNKRCLGDFLFARPMRLGMPCVAIDAIGALGRQRDAERDQLTVFSRNDTVVALGRLVEREECAPLGRSKAEKLGNGGQVFAALVLAHGKSSFVQWRLPIEPVSPAMDSRLLE